MQAVFWGRLRVLLDLPPGPDPARRVMASIDREQAEYGAKSLNQRSPRWHEYLPTCPRLAPRGRAEWDQDNPVMLACFHPGAASCVRSAGSYASVNADGHQQQCCYDAAGGLIAPEPSDRNDARGRGAGTPDFAGTSWPQPRSFDGDTLRRDGGSKEAELLKLKALALHARIDVIPFLAMNGDVARYHQHWPPNRGPIRAGGKARVIEPVIELRQGDVVLVEPESEMARASKPGDGTGRLTAGTLRADGGEAGLVAIQGSACLIASAAGKLMLGTDSAVEFYVHWRRLRARTQCSSPTTIVTLPPT